MPETASQNNNDLNSDPRNSDLSAAPLVERLDAVRERIASRLTRPAVAPADYDEPPFHALQDSRTAAAMLADAIGTVNPRPPGLLNEVLQTGKRAAARLLGWIVRPQRDFNQSVLEALARTSEVLEVANKNVLSLRDALAGSAPIYHEIFDRIERLDEKMKLQKWALDGAIARQGNALQTRTYELLGEVQEHLWEEMRTLRQRMAGLSKADSALLAGSPAQASGESATAPAPGIDYFQLERHFRGSEEEIRKRQSFYLPFFEGRRNVLDIACGRGEFLELMKQAKVPARGVDLDTDMVGRCLDKGLKVTQADVFQYLDAVPDGSLDGMNCSQFVEHMDTKALLRLLARCAEKLAPGGILAIETPNPECLAIFSQSFYNDPTHVRPIPPALMRVLFSEAGFQKVATHFLSPSPAALPAIPNLKSAAIEPEALRAWNAEAAKFNETYFGGMDYAMIGYRADSRSAGAPASL